MWNCIFDHPRSSVVYNFVSVCLYVCLCFCQKITFESLDVGSSVSHIWYISTEYGSILYTRVIRSRSQEQKGRKSQFPQCNTSISNNSGSVKHRAMKFTCSMGFLATIDHHHHVACPELDVAVRMSLLHACRFCARW